MKIKLLNIGKASEEVITPIVKYLQSIRDDLFCALTAMPMQNIISLQVHISNADGNEAGFSAILPNALTAPAEILVGAFHSQVIECLNSYSFLREKQEHEYTPW